MLIIVTPLVEVPGRGPTALRFRRRREIVGNLPVCRTFCVFDSLLTSTIRLLKFPIFFCALARSICDGAGTVIVASEKACHEHNLTPLARIVSYGIVGCDPTIMGIGPVPAIHQALNKAGVKLSDVDRVEINEAFAAQFLACAKELDLDMDKTNLHGGAISLGHPLGASGSRIMAHLANEFGQEGNANKLHLGAACIGGGQGIAVLIERA